MGDGIITLNTSWFTRVPGTEHGNVAVATLKGSYLKEAQKIAQEKIAAYTAADIQAARTEKTDRVKLTDEQKKYLADTYRPREMSREEYVAFARDLEKFGIINADDRRLLGCGEKKGLSLSPVGERCGAWVSDISSALSFEDCRGNLLDWVRYRASFQKYDPASGAFYRDREARLYEKLSSALQQIGV